jgi:outer membrane protein assembly factor BamB
VYRISVDDGALLQTIALAGEGHTAADSHPGERYQHHASGVTVANDLAYVGTDAGELVCFALDDGSIRWRYRAGDAITTTPTAAGGRVLFGSFDGHVRAVLADSGELAWDLDTGAPVVSQVAVADGIAVVGSRSYDLFALDLETGEPVWHDYFWFSWVESPATIDDGRVFLGSSDAQRVRALRLQDGARLWEADVDGSAWARVALTPSTAYAGTVGVAGYLIPHTARLVALDRATGGPRWHHELEPREGARLWGFAGAPCVVGSRVIAAAIDGRVLAFPRD